MRFPGVCFALITMASAAYPQAQAPKPNNTIPIPDQPTKVFDQAWVLPAGWLSRIPATGAVNAPGHFEVVAPGQLISIGLLAGGTSRDAALAGRRLEIRVTGMGATRDIPVLECPGVRRIKADGADFSLRLLCPGLFRVGVGAFGEVVGDDLVVHSLERLLQPLVFWQNLVKSICDIPPFYCGFLFFLRLVICNG